MAKTKEVTEEIEKTEGPEVTAKDTKGTSGDSVFSREDIAASEAFRSHRWIIYAVIKAGEMVTIKEAQRRVDVFLNTKY